MAATSLFICHAQPDTAFADDLGVALEICRLSVWRDKHHVRGGEQFVSEVRWAIEQAQQVIVVLSLQMGDAPWLRREIEFAQEVERKQGGTYRVIPVLLPGTDESLCARWFSSPPRTAPIRLPPAGLGAALPDLLKVLGARPPSDPSGSHHVTPLADLELHFSRHDAEIGNSWQLDTRLTSHPGSQPATLTDAVFVSLPNAPNPRLIHWYLHDHLTWPADAVRYYARKVDALLESWGRALYQIALVTSASETLTATWHAVPLPAERRLVLSVDMNEAAAPDVLTLPWELLHDSKRFLLQEKQPFQIVRRLPGGGQWFPATPPPLRILALAPRPDTEPTGHADYRRGIQPLLDSLHELGGLTEELVLTPPTLPALKKSLQAAWTAGRPFIALHLDSYLRTAPDSDEILIGFEASDDIHPPICRDADFVTASALAALLVSYPLRLVVLHSSGPANAHTAALMVRLAATLLAAGLAAVMTTHPDTPEATQQRFWAVFYEELLHGARMSHALFTSQRRLANDSYRAPALGGGSVYLNDWFCYQLYLGEHDPPLCWRPPLELWRRLLKQGYATLPEPLARLAVGFVGRGRDLLILERLLEGHVTVFLRSPGSNGKTAAAAALGRWLLQGGYYRHVAYVNSDDVREPRDLLEVLGRQLLPEGQYWSIERYPTLWQALDHLQQKLHTHPTLVILDQLELWPSEYNDTFGQFWKVLMDNWPTLRLLGLGRLGPPAFAQPWREKTLSPMDEPDAVELIGRTLNVTQQLPPATDPITGFKQLRQLAVLAGGHPGALQRVTQEIARRGATATLTLLRSLHSELLRLHSQDAQWPLYLSLELTLCRLPAADREQLLVLAFFRYGANRLALGKALALDMQGLDAFCSQLIDLGLVENRGYGHLRFDSALSSYLHSLLPPDQRSAWREHWRTGMEHLLAVLYPQYFKDNARTTRLLRLELPNLLALLRDYQQRSNPEAIAQLAGCLEQLVANLGVAAALNEVISARERASQALSGWSRARFEAERLRIERLRDDGALEESVQAARQLLQQCQQAGDDSYSGARYDLARAHFQLGKLLKLTSATESAVQELSTARQQFQALADAGNPSAGRMAAVADAETGDCLTYLQHLEEAAASYEAAIARAGSTAISPAFATDRMQLGLVRQRQGRYAESAELYDAARHMFETLGELEGAARAWQHLSIVRKLNGEIELALHACQQALYRYEQQRSRSGMTETLNELGHLHQVLNQLDEAALAYRRMAELCARLGDGLGEEASRNKLAHILIQLHRHDEARQELYRASECNLPNSLTARNWSLRRGLHDIGQAVPNPQVADQARQQAIRQYLAYRRAGGENTNPGARLCTRVSQAIRANDLADMTATLEQMAASPNVPPAGKLLLSKLQAILDGSRDPALTTDPNLHYQYAVELQLLLEGLTR